MFYSVNSLGIRCPICQNLVGDQRDIKESQTGLMTGPHLNLVLLEVENGGCNLRFYDILFVICEIVTAHAYNRIIQNI